MTCSCAEEACYTAVLTPAQRDRLLELLAGDRSRSRGSTAELDDELRDVIDKAGNHDAGDCHLSGPRDSRDVPRPIKPSPMQGETSP